MSAYCGVSFTWHSAERRRITEEQVAKAWGQTLELTAEGHKRTFQVTETSYVLTVGTQLCLSKHGTVHGVGGFYQMEITSQLHKQAEFLRASLLPNGSQPDTVQKPVVHVHVFDSGSGSVGLGEGKGKVTGLFGAESLSAGI